AFIAHHTSAGSMFPLLTPQENRPMRSARDFFQPLAVGAPNPLMEIPFRPSRMIHFLDPSNERMVEKAPGIAQKTDILLGNLEDAIQIKNKEAAREGFIKMAN